MYETLLQEAHEEEIEVVCIPLHGELKGLYSCNVIAINSNTATEAEKACILAEELGHYHTTVGDILDQTKTQNRKQERQACAWSYRRLVPLEKLIQASDLGIRTRPDLAENLHITEQLLVAALRHYKEKYGLYCNSNGYWICFEPLGVVKVFGLQTKEPANGIVLGSKHKQIYWKSPTRCIP